MVGGISMDEVDPEKELSDLFPGAGAFVAALSGCGGARAVVVVVGEGSGGGGGGESGKWGSGEVGRRLLEEVGGGGREQAG